MADGCRQENHANAGFELGCVHRRHGARRPRQVDGGASRVAVDARPVDRTADRREHGQARARARCRSSTNRLARPTNTARTAPSSSSPPSATRRTRRRSALQAAGHPILSLTTRLDGLGAEFFRWEFATAVAGAALHINPFDEPNVAEAKAKTSRAAEDLRRRSIGSAEAAPLVESDEVAVYTRRLRRYAARTASRGAVSRSSRATTWPSFHICRRMWPPRTRSPRSASASGARPARPRRSASGRAICIRPASTTRAARTPRSSS